MYGCVCTFELFVNGGAFLLTKLKLWEAICMSKYGTNLADDAHMPKHASHLHSISLAAGQGWLQSKQAAPPGGTWTPPSRSLRALATAAAFWYESAPTDARPYFQPCMQEGFKPASP